MSQDVAAGGVASSRVMVERREQDGAADLSANS